MVSTSSRHRLNVETNLISHWGLYGGPCIPLGVLAKVTRIRSILTKAFMVPVRVEPRCCVGCAGVWSSVPRSAARPLIYEDQCRNLTSPASTLLLLLLPYGEFCRKIRTRRNGGRGTSDPDCGSSDLFARHNVICTTTVHCVYRCSKNTSLVRQYLLSKRISTAVLHVRETLWFRMALADGHGYLLMIIPRFGNNTQSEMIFRYDFDSISKYSSRFDVESTAICPQN